VLALAAAVGVWARQQLLDTDRWVQTSDDLLREPEIRDELARYLAVQLAGPYRSQVEQAARRALDAPAVEAVWRTTNRAAHARFVALVHSDRESDLEIELRPVLVALGRTVGWPTALLPAGAGRLRVLRADQLDKARDAAEVLDTIAWWSVLLAALAIAAALLLGGTRVLVTLGIGLGVVALLLIGLRELGGTVVADEVGRRGGAEEAASAAWAVGTSLLREIAIGVGVAGAAALTFGLVARARA
jgi:hypothetical protein